ncbi:MAG: carotenoid biosynthesis protein [Candidatus Viridilinea halotolerans]|uniref:Carotenoid biosynthesis protein n=1 Tax=Candidatus Viridilinea halotolerans TaxID=2491704 RepID=A0A426TTA8_9CHLR|nr:MAG: carotenoid biosynthesis protein [Candidatus Viridilinea halotolerans]
MRRDDLQLRSLVTALFALYLFLYPFSLALVALDRVPVWGTWMGGALLILQGTILGLWLTINFGRWGAVASFWVLFLSWLIEHVGATTGFPFGSYSYTDVLQPQVLGVVPLAIPFAWLLIVPAAMAVGDRIIYRKGVPVGDEREVRFARVLMAAAFALLLDVTIEPFAVNVNQYWVWSDASAGTYYGIPFSNFVAWFVTSLILSWVLLVYRAKAAQNRPTAQRAVYWPWLPVTLYMTNLTMFVVVNLARDQEYAAYIGGLIMLVLIVHWAQPRLARWLREADQKSGIS